MSIFTKGLLLSLTGIAIGIGQLSFAADDPTPESGISAVFDSDKDSLFRHTGECERIILSKTGCLKILGVSEVCYDRRFGPERYGLQVSLLVNMGKGGVDVYHHSYVLVKPYGKTMESVEAYDVDKVASLPEIFLLSPEEFRKALTKIDTQGVNPEQKSSK